jgi:RNA polymerase sigma factor (sigma-70 family)
VSLLDRISIQQILAGSRQAVMSFWERWSSKILAFLRNSGVASLEEREDLAQGILYKVFADMGEYNPFYSPSTWIFTICRNHLLSYRRSQKVNLPLAEPDYHPSQEHLAESLESKTERELIQEYVSAQPEDIRQIIYLHF